MKPAGMTACSTKMGRRSQPTTPTKQLHDKGFLIDLATYDSQDNLIPESGSYPVKNIVVGVQDRSRVASIRVLTSLTATDDVSRPSKVAARHIGQAGTAPFVVDVATISASLKTETWTLTAVSPTSFTVSASRSGAQGTATVGTAFNANNGAVSFTIPAGANPYITGDRFEFETFVGDGWREATTWVNPGLSGAGDIVISLPAAVQARYVSLQFVKAVGAPAFTLDEIAVQDDSGANVSQGKLYLLGGYHQTVVEPDDNVPPQSAASLSPDPAPDGHLRRSPSLLRLWITTADRVCEICSIHSTDSPQACRTRSRSLWRRHSDRSVLCCG